MEIKYGGSRNTKLSKPLGYPDPQNKHIIQQQNKHNNKSSCTISKLTFSIYEPILLFCGQFPNCSNVEMPKTLLPSVGCNAENLDKKI